MVSQPTVGHRVSPCKITLSNFEIEQKICRKLYRRGMQLLRVYAYEVSPHGGYLVRPYFCAVVVISHKQAAIAEVTKNGNIGRFSPIPCNGSVSKKSMHSALGFDSGVRIYAKEFGINA